MATKKAAPKKAPPPPKTRPGAPIQVYGPKSAPARAPGARYATMPPPSRPLPRVTAPATRPAPVPPPPPPPAPVPPPSAPMPARPLRPVGPEALPPPAVPVAPPSEDMIQAFPAYEPMQEPMYGPTPPTTPAFKRGGFVKKADGIAKRGKTKGRYI